MTEPSTSFHRLQRVRIVDEEFIGYVAAQRPNCLGQSYHVVYWHDGTRRDGWFYANDLEAA